MAIFIDFFAFLIFEIFAFAGALTVSVVGVVTVDVFAVGVLSVTGVVTFYLQVIYSLMNRKPLPNHM